MSSIRFCFSIVPQNENQIKRNDQRILVSYEKAQKTVEHEGDIQDIGIEFIIEKCTTLVMKSGKRHMTKGMEQPNQGNIRTLGEKETYKYLGILEADTIKQMEMKEKNKKSISGDEKPT